jgi:glycosyltransferase involved in cell wall biosynthesis
MYAFYILWEYNALKYINRLIVPTSKTVEEFEKYYHYSSSLVSIVPLGQDLFDRYGLNIENKKINKFKGKKVLLFVGTSGWYRKGAWYLLLAFRIVHSRIPNTILVLTGPPVKPLTILARKLKLTNSIIFTGEIDEKTLAELYAVSDIFVLPSFHEGFSQTVVEAMAFGNPVVTTPIAGYPTVTEGIEGFIVKPNDYKSIAISIIRLLENKELYDKMSNNAMEKAKKYTWRASAEKLLAIYEAVLKSHNASINITNNR